MNAMKLSWKRAPDNSWSAELGNNLYILIRPVTVWVPAKGRSGRGRDHRYWDPAVVVGPPFHGSVNVTNTIVVRRWGGGGNGHGQYKRLSAAKLGGIEDAKAVGTACLRSIGVIA